MLSVVIDPLKLKNIIPVIQDWGSGIGFHYANRFPDRISGLVFLEAIVRPISWSDTNLLERFIFKRFCGAPVVCGLAAHTCMLTREMLLSPLIRDKTCVNMLHAKQDVHLCRCYLTKHFLDFMNHWEYTVERSTREVHEVMKEQAILKFFFSSGSGSNFTVEYYIFDY